MDYVVWSLIYGVCIMEYGLCRIEEVLGMKGAAEWGPTISEGRKARHREAIPLYHILHTP